MKSRYFEIHIRPSYRSSRRMREFKKIMIQIQSIIAHLFVDLIIEPKETLIKVFVVVGILSFIYLIVTR